SGSFTTSHAYTLLPKCCTSFWMCSWILAITVAWLAAELVPSPVAYDGVCAPPAHTRLWPRMRMLLHTASPTCASAFAKLKLPLVCSTELHFMSLPDVMLLKCLI